MNAVAETKTVDTELLETFLRYCAEKYKVVLEFQKSSVGKSLTIDVSYPAGTDLDTGVSLTSALAHAHIPVRHKEMSQLAVPGRALSVYPDRTSGFKIEIKESELPDINAEIRRRTGELMSDKDAARTLRTLEILEHKL